MKDHADAVAAPAPSADRARRAGSGRVHRREAADDRRSSERRQADRRHASTRPPTSIHADSAAEETPDVEAARAIEILSHELRSSITTLHLGTKVLRSGHGPAGSGIQDEVIEVLEAEVERLFRLTEDFIAVARHEGNGAPLPGRPLLLHRWLPAILASEATAMPAVRLRALIDPDLPPVLVDDGGLAHVVRNLIANAGRFAPGGAPVEIVVGRGEGGTVRLSVLDRGPGIDPDEAEHLFSPFYRSPRTGTANGAGPGLAAARRLLRAMGGTIEARSREGGGAQLIVTLPSIEGDEDDASAETEVPAGGRAIPGTSLATATINAAARTTR